MNKFISLQHHVSDNEHTASVARARRHGLLRASILSLTVAAGMVMSPIVSARAILNVCAGSVDATFKSKCESHANYQAVNLRLAGDGGCMQMCCKGHPDTGYTCASDPNQIVDRSRSDATHVGETASTIAAPKRPAKTVFIPATPAVAAPKK
jgi:hypothetical protein